MEKILSYLTEARNVKPEVAKKICAAFERHDDIRTELESWIDTKAFPQDSPMIINGYTAEKVAGLAPFMDGVGVYNFMITLRERPDNAEKIIAAGFPRK
jgi:hypothetical protein